MFSEQARKTKLTPEPSSSPGVTAPSGAGPGHATSYFGNVDQLLGLSVLQFPQLFSFETRIYVVRLDCARYIVKGALELLILLLPPQV